MTTHEVYREWKDSVKGPEENLFYSFKSLERIVLGLAIYDIASRPILRQSKKIYVLHLYNILTDEMLSAWIKQSDDFKRAFNELLDKTEAIGYGCRTLAKEHPESKETLVTINNTYLFWICVANSIDDALVDELLADIKMEGTEIYSEKINQLIDQHQPSVAAKTVQITGDEILEILSRF